MGSKLITKPLLEAKQYDQITQATREVMAIIKSIQA
jgi:2-keto-3-deoxy-6-phosphogluconate aldolase